MIKLTFCLRRLPDLTREEFQRYWRTTHAQLVADRADVLNIRRYVQLHTVDLDALHAALQRRNGGSPEPYDGVAELWFDSLDEMTTQEPAALEAAADLLADERTFIDLPNSPMWLSVEHTIVPPPNS